MSSRFADSLLCQSRPRSKSADVGAAQRVTHDAAGSLLRLAEFDSPVDVEEARSCSLRKGRNAKPTILVNKMTVAAVLVEQRQRNLDQTDPYTLPKSKAQL